MRSVFEKGFAVYLIILLVGAVLASLPATWLLMLFLGNFGLGISFWGALPGGILITFFAAGAGLGGRQSFR